MEHQGLLFPSELIFSAAPSPEVADLTPSLSEEIAALWGLPLDQRIQVTLRNHPLQSTIGRMELTRLPTLPLDAHEPLSLRIGKDEFTSRQIVAWSLAD